jgi:predicted O-linked N-acetylglucosamine transferase (SPINDLY family)
LTSRETGMTPPQLLDQAIRNYQAGRLDDAAQLCDHLLTLDPANVDAILLKGMIRAASGALDDAVASFTQAASLRPDRPDIQYNLAKALRESGRLDDSIAAYRRAIALQPAFPAAHNNLGNALKAAGQLREAAEAYRQAISLKPDYAESSFNLGTILQQLDDFPGAINAYRSALAIRPNYPQALNNLGIAFRSLDALDDAIAAYKRALAFKPDFADAAANLGSALRDSAHVSEALKWFQHAARMSSDPRLAHNLLATLHLDPNATPGSLLAAHVQWASQYSHLAPIQPHHQGPSPDRKLRIGYVSPDFRDHPVGRFILPLLTHHDRKKFEVFCYADVEHPDAITEQIRANAATWRQTTGLTDDRLAALIRDDDIDILIDLTLHYDGSRLLTFARKPAPVQIAYLAYGSTSGLDAMDYRITDPYLDPLPPDEATAQEYDRTRYSERSLWLQKSYWCYTAPPQAPQVAPLAALSIGHITFGCLNNFAKVSPPTLDLWARLVLALPSSRIHIASPRGSHRAQVHARFANLGILSERVVFIDRLRYQDYFAAYNAIDIALDPFPYNGGTTTCDALWMGVPVVTLSGAIAVSRAGLSILSNAGLPDLAVNSPDAYIETALHLASDLPRLAKLRAELRSLMLNSSLLDAVGFTRDMESLYRKTWTRWCKSQVQPH